MASVTPSFSNVHTPQRHLVLEIRRPDGSWFQAPLAGVHETHEEAVRSALAISPDWTFPEWVRIVPVLQ